MKLKQLSFTLLTFFLATIVGTPAAKAAALTTIASGLRNAQGITFGPDGNLYVGESGTGGNGRCQSSPSAQGELICAGNTGSVLKISPNSGEVERLFEGFESLALQPSQNQGAGPQKVEFDSSGSAYLITGYAGNPGNRDAELNAAAANLPAPPPDSFGPPLLPPDQVLNTSSLAKLYKVDLNTQELTPVFDFARYELFNNPDGGDIVSNPYGIAIKDDTAYVSDGGGNAVYSVKLDGSEVTAIGVPTQTIDNPEYPPIPPDQLPGGALTGGGPPPAGAPAGGAPAGGPPAGGPPAQIELQSVTTGITVGPDGDVYFGEYTGFPYPEGEARIFRLQDDGQLEVIADDFTQITDLTFDKDGNLLVLQFSDESEWRGEDIRFLPGSLIQVAPDGTRTTLVAAGEGLESSIGIDVSPDNEIYVTKRGVGTLGEVVRVDRSEPVPEPSSMLGLLAVGALGGRVWLKRKRKQLAS